MTSVAPIFWLSKPPDLSSFAQTVLPFGQGRSYGDSCLNDGGALIDTSPLSRFIRFDHNRGVIQCEAGVTLAEILGLIVPRGWFLPVTPGTKYVSVGGAIAHDIHGKNHHTAGTFSQYITRFELLRSSGERFVCSPTENAELFSATIGGLGLTGLVLWVEIKLKPVTGPLIDMESIRFSGLDEFFDISAQSDSNYEYTAAWIDCLAHGRKVGRGIFMRGNHVQTDDSVQAKAKRPRVVRIPFDLPGVLLNRVTMRAFNTVYYHAQLHKHIRKTVHYESFLYPLDSIHEWNRMYGKRGFLQYQCVVPYGDYCVIREILTQIARSGEASFLTVMKIFGPARSAGMLSFPRQGVTLALDFPFRGEQTLQLLDRFDEVVRVNGGAVYPAKDARMSARSFQSFFPQWSDFTRFVDPRFSSSFWRRVSAELH
jgi:FAD/FMN-containing dehydrogenase